MMSMNGIKVRLLDNRNWLCEAGYDVEQEARIYEELLKDVYNNPRWYLDSLEYMPEFRVSWVDYKKQKTTRPYKFVVKQAKKD
jgi:hypothetical protein